MGSVGEVLPSRDSTRIVKCLSGGACATFVGK